MLAALYLLAIPAPFAGWSGPLPGALSYGAAAAHIYGMTPIDVFNRADLGMAENWFTISRIDGAGEELVPVFSADGSRLGMHRSDRVYFGSTLAIRRQVIGRQGCFFDDFRKPIELISSRFANVGNFRFRQYLKPLPNFERLVLGAFEVQPASVVCERDFSLQR